MFKFNFKTPDSQETGERDTGSSEACAPLGSDSPISKREIFNNSTTHILKYEHKISSQAAQEIPLCDHHIQVAKDSRLSCIYVTAGRLNLCLVSAAWVEDQLKADYASSPISSSLVSHSDLMPGVYEGGLKIWECAIDLANYIMANSVVVAGTYVLELGCGAGIPGIVAYLQGATVHFQDFNSEALNLVTIPNVLLNVKEDGPTQVSHQCKFFAGDWTAVESLLFDTNMPTARYDAIFTSETIYNPENYKKLLSLMKRALKPSGTIYLAAKTCYFGVGGSTKLFEEIIRQDGAMESQVCHVFTEGIRREILKITFKP